MIEALSTLAKYVLVGLAGLVWLYMAVRMTTRAAARTKMEQEREKQRYGKERKAGRG